MSAPISSQPLSPQNTSLIAGQSSGKPIRCIPELKPVYLQLQKAAHRNHHWARIAVKELNALTTGMLGKNNVYVRPESRRSSGGSEKYYVFLPGLKATVVRWPNDQFCITELVLDDNYYHTHRSGQEQTRLGTYRAKLGPNNSSWHTQYVEDGQVSPISGRLVTVADSHYETANDAANYSIAGAMTFLGKNTISVRIDGCDLHFTPGNKRLGSLVCYDPITVDSSRASAVHLAATMEQARKVRSVAWVADFGGSAVLTQAMQILANKGVTLPDHTVYFYRPRTSPAKALKLAHQLKLSVNKNFADTGLSARGALSQFSVAGRRMNNKNDLYDRNEHATAWLKGAISISTPIGVAAAVVGGPAMVMLGSIATAIGGVGVSYAVGQSVAQDVRRRFKL
ncbi:hypothetical protein KUV22_14730 [Microbulbifer agarilyticus]|uniref:hypothetical protein n=1 Tax=Microbulbifer agarilyticus TaxID=260552 RepID=UPI001C9549D9|nr:hypothetical protein [Microbulbifer agarilyticus]MBY6191686.1 hypothetical protein [Microbulbifer agarilyticus]